jgi:c-di-GMP-binding flagellar brake protein YcgR
LFAFFKKEVAMTYTGPERRKHPRIAGRFVVSYRVLEEVDNIDISQTRNLSMGGMLLTTNRQFSPGTSLALEIRLPFDPNPIMLITKVVESREITKDLIYDTRLNFLAIDERHKKAVSQTVTYYLRKG